MTMDMNTVIVSDLLPAETCCGNFCFMMSGIPTSQTKLRKIFLGEAITIAYVERDPDPAFPVNADLDPAPLQSYGNLQSLVYTIGPPAALWNRNRNFLTSGTGTVR